MPDWTIVAMLAILAGVPAICALLEWRAVRRHKPVRFETRWPPAEPDWTEAHGPGSARAFQFNARLHQAHVDYVPPGY